MSTTIRANRLLDAKRNLEAAKTPASKIAALREVLSVPRLGRIHIRLVGKEILALRAEVVDNEELLRRLDQLDTKLVFRKDEEAQRLARKHERDTKKQPKTEPAVAPTPARDLPW
jgi:hypothetical protein